MEKRESQNHKKVLRAVVIFTLVAVFCWWIGVLIDQAFPNLSSTTLGANGEKETPGMGIFIVAPLLTVILLLLTRQIAWRDLLFVPHFRGVGRWYILAFFIYPIVTCITLLLFHNFWILTVKDWYFPWLLSIFITGFFTLLIKNIFEESVWRGFLTTHIHKLFPKNILWVYVIVGIIWSLWHLPYYFVFLPDLVIHDFIPYGRWALAIISIPLTICWSIMYTELLFLSRSIWPLVLMHTVEDGLVNPIILNWFIDISKEWIWLVHPIYGFFPNMLFLLFGLWLMRKRKHKEALEILW